VSRTENVFGTDISTPLCEKSMHDRIFFPFLLFLFMFFFSKKKTLFRSALLSFSVSCLLIRRLSLHSRFSTVSW